MRVTLARLALVPAAVVAVVVAVPYLVGDDPLTWDQLRRQTLAQVTRLPGHPGAGQVDDEVAGPSAPLPAPSPSAPQERYPVRTVRHAWAPGTPQLGVQVYWESNDADPDRVVWAKAQRIVDYVTGLNANSLTVSFPFFTAGMQASTVGGQQHTPTPHRLEILVHEASLAGLHVTVRPILDEKTLHPPDGWRGSIRPDSVPGWFASYRAFLTPYLQAAERQRAAAFVVGTELNSMEPRPGWKDLVAAAHAAFSGEIVYDLNYDNYARGIFPAGMDGYGIDAYIPVHAPTTPASDTVSRAWDEFLASADRDAPRGAIISEVGIPARRGAWGKPGDFTSSGAYDPEIQPTWYRGVCEVARRRRIGGLYFWKVDFDADPAHPPAGRRPTMDFLGRATSEQAIRDCLGSPWTVPPPDPTPRAATPRAGTGTAAPGHRDAAAR